MQQPLVTLGVPVYNEGEFLRESLENFLAQTYPHCEILLVDNGSTDKSPEICQEYAARYPQITAIRHPVNIGQNANFNYIARCASGTYFCWAAAHDLFDLHFVERCVAALEAHPEAVLAYTRTIYMAKDGTTLGEKSRPFDIRAMSPSRRFREVMWRVDCNYVYGLWRLAPLLESNLFQLFPAADRVLLAEMAIKGAFVPADTAKYGRANRGVRQTENEKRRRLIQFIFPRRTVTDADVEGNRFYAPTFRGFRNAVLNARFSFFVRRQLLFSVWLCGVMKSHLFPGADLLSIVVKAVLPTPVLRMILRRMQ